MDRTAIRDLDDWVTGFASLQERMRQRLESPVPGLRPLGERASEMTQRWRELGFERSRLGIDENVMTRHTGSHVIVVALGIGRVRTADSASWRDIQPGSVVLFPAGSDAAWRAETALDVCILALDRRTVDRVAKEASRAGTGHPRLDTAYRYYDFGMIGLAGVLAEEAARGVRGNNLYVNSLSSLLAAHLLRHYVQWQGGEPDAGRRSAFERTLNAPEPVQRAIVHIRENHTRDLAAQEIADAAGVNAFVLKRLFWESLGTEPGQYVLQLRMQSAESLLSAGARSLPEIAQAVGFGDQRALLARRAGA